ncbi:MAG: hypothetical protein CMI09_15900 [Oceanospirillaceae bacterium]|nr:hypothetical protein [Oceanospirillaceae bacterium]|tara:strand:- start:1590 stop:1820 length:231 start_codon:yes stop_codon:yes gene_type:complete
MTASLEQSRETIINLYRTKFQREHIGIRGRPDVCVTLEFLVWLKTNHPTVLNFGASNAEAFDTIRTWLKLHITGKQ